MTFKTIIILAKSEKNRGYCIAGRELIMNGEKSALGGWIRPVSSDLTSHGALFDYHFQAKRFSKVDVLDVVNVPIIEMAPEPGQPENFLIDDQRPWQTLTRMPANMLDICIEQPKDLWLQPGYDSRIVPAALDDEKHVSQSLYVIKPSDLRFRLTHELTVYDSEPTFKTKIWALFSYNDQGYCMTVTDPIIKRLLSRRYPGPGMPANEFLIENSNEYRLCISLTPRFNAWQHHYKLVSTVFYLGGSILKDFR